MQNIFACGKHNVWVRFVKALNSHKQCEQFLQLNLLNNGWKNLDVMETDQPSIQVSKIYSLKSESGF